MVTQEIYLYYFYMHDKMLGPTVDPSGLQGPPGSSFHWSVTRVKIL